jgi:cytochrome c553
VNSKQLAVSSKLLVFFAFLLFTFYFFTACAEGPKIKRQFVIADSKSYEASIFRQNCAICHGQEANGKEMMDGKQIPSLRYGDAATKSETEIYEQIKNGKLPMPAFKNQLSEEDIQKMVKFVMRDLQGRDVK